MAKNSILKLQTALNNKKDQHDLLTKRLSQAEEKKYQLEITKLQQEIDFKKIEHNNLDKNRKQEETRE